MGTQNIPITNLQQIFSQFGSDLLDDPLRLQGLILDFMGGDRIARLLIKSLEDGVLNKLLEIGGAQADSISRDRLAKTLHDNLLYELKIAYEIVEAWYIVLQGLEKALPAAPLPSRTTNFFCGELVSPLLQQTGQKKRLGSGRFITGFGLDTEHILLVFAGGVGLYSKENSQPQGWIETIAVSAALTQNGLLLAIGQPNGAIELWDIAGGSCRHTLQVHTRPVTALEFSGDGRFLASGDESGRIIVWDSVSGWPAREWKNRSGAVLSIAFQPNSEQLITASSDCSVQIWDLTSGETKGDLPIHESVRSLACSPDGRYLVTGGDQQRVTLWDLETQKSLIHRVIHPDIIRKVMFLKDNRLLSISSQAVIECGIEDNTDFMRYDAPGLLSLSAIAFQNGEILIVETGEYNLNVRHVKGEPLWISFEFGIDTSHALTFSPQGSWLAFADDNSIRLMDYHTGNLFAGLDGHNFEILDLTCSPNGRYLVSCGADGALRLWDADEMKLIKMLWKSGDWLNAVRFAPDGSMLAFGGEDGCLTLLSFPNGKLAHQWMIRSAITRLTYSPDGRLVAAGDENGRLTIWNSRTRDLLYSISVHSGPVRALSISGDGSKLVSGGEDGIVRILNLFDGKEVDQVKMPAWVTSIAFHPTEQQFMVGCGDGSVCFYSLNQKSRSQFLRLHTESIRGLAFSMDGRLLASAGEDRTIALWQTDELTKKGVR